jgi:hypothetical protein
MTRRRNYVWLGYVFFPAGQHECSDNSRVFSNLFVRPTPQVSLALGGDKLQEAYLSLQELVEKFGPSVQICNTLAVCQIHLKKYPEAMELLTEARELAAQSKQKVSADTLVNQILVLQHLQKGPEAIAKAIRYISSILPLGVAQGCYCHLNTVTLVSDFPSTLVIIASTVS